ncbi:MAG: methionyl-tRNA formyltransferase [Deltaproteobacteria bacterium]|nr:MAG: methionyl-tRNA formyltransferase [Deltaproteobacteria bacterium]
MSPERRRLHVVFMGTAPFSLLALRVLSASEKVAAVVTQPDRPRGRGRKVSPPPVKEFATDLGLPVLQPERVKDQDFISLLKELHPELIVVAAFGQILPSALLEIPPLGCVNVHPSLLPKYRGAAPINWAIIKGEARTGVTTYLMDEGMDTGDILLVQEAEVGRDETAQELGERLAELGAKLLLETIRGLKEGTLQPIPQDEEGASYAPMLKKDDGLIQWEWEAHQIRNQIRGMIPWPVAFTLWGGKRIKIYQGITGDGKGIPGEVISLQRAIEVACGERSLFIKELQMEGGRRMGWDEFARGHRLTLGERLG